MDLETAINLVADYQLGILAATKEEAKSIIECAQRLSASASFEVDPDLTDVPEQWPVFGRSEQMLTWYRQPSTFVATHEIVKASDLLATPLDSSAVADLL